MNQFTEKWRNEVFLLACKLHDIGEGKIPLQLSSDNVQLLKESLVQALGMLDVTSEERKRVKNLLEKLNG